MRLPAGATLQQIVLREKQIGLMWLIQQLKEAEERQQGSWQGVWKKTFGEESQNRDRPKPPRRSSKPSRCWKTFSPSTINWRR